MGAARPFLTGFTPAKTRGFVLCVSILLCILFPVHTASGSQQEQHTYLVTKGDDRYISTWELEQGDTVTIRSKQNDEMFVTTCSKAGETLMMEASSRKENIRAWRTEDTLHINGTIDGKEINKSFTIDNAPWYQPLTYSLKEFLSSERNQVEFWMLHPETYYPFKLKADKQEILKVTLHDREIEVRHVEVRIAGVLSLLWHGDYWYRTHDNVLVEYRGLNGPPGSSKTVVQLMEPTGKFTNQ